MQKRAFTLIELSMVLIIVGIMIGGGFKVFKSQKEKAYVDRAKQDVLIAKDAIIGNAIINDNTLPNAIYFEENLSPIKSNQHPLLYAYETTLNTQNICTVPSTSLVIKRSGKPDINDIAFVVVSESANHNMQTIENSNTITLYTAADKVDDNTSPINRVENYDDVAEWVTLAELQKQVDCSKYQLSILNESSLPKDLENTAYLGASSASIYADGGFAFSDGGDSDSDPDYEWCIENAPSWLDDNQCNGTLKKCSDGYSQCTIPTLDGATTGSPGIYSFRIYAKDKTGNTVNKKFTITIDTDTSAGAGGGGGLPFP